MKNASINLIISNFVLKFILFQKNVFEVISLVTGENVIVYWLTAYLLKW